MINEKNTIIENETIGLSVIQPHKQKTHLSVGFLLMVPLVRIGLTTPPLPRVCSTTEL